MSKKHRGRIQAQGEGLEKSVSWAQDEPLTKKELDRRKKPLEDAKRYIQNVKGGADAVKKKTFRNRKTKDTRIDIEILGGTAFISMVLIILFIYLRVVGICDVNRYPVDP